jgi:hypothetical protein
MEDDPEIRAAIKQLALTAIEEAADLIQNAAPNVKANLIRQLLPPLAKSLAAGKGEDDALKEMRVAIEAMYGVAMTEWGGND